MKKLLKKLSVMRLEERVLFDAAAAAAAAEAEQQAQQSEELQQQQQQLQEQLAEEAAKQQAAQEAAQQAAEEAQESDSEAAASPEAAQQENAFDAAAATDVAAAVEAIAADEGVEVEAESDVLEVVADETAGDNITEENAIVPQTTEEIASAIADGTRHELVIVSNAVKDSKVIIDSLAEGTEVLVLDNESDVLDQINEYLDKSAVKYDAIHVVSHGGDGYILLNNSVVDITALKADPASWAAIGEHIAEDGDIMLYGCNVAQTENGKAFANQLASLTGADIAASIDSVGGNYGWELEYVTNAVHTPAYTFSGYTRELATLTLVESGSFGSGEDGRNWSTHTGIGALGAGTYYAIADTTHIRYNGTTAVTIEAGQLFTMTGVAGEGGAVTRTYAAVANSGNAAYVLGIAEGTELVSDTIVITSTNLVGSADLGNIAPAVRVGGLTINLGEDVSATFNAAGDLVGSLSVTGTNNSVLTQTGGNLRVVNGESVTISGGFNLVDLKDVEVVGSGTQFAIEGAVADIRISDSDSDNEAIWVDALGGSFTIDAQATGFEVGASNVIVNGDVRIVGSTFTVDLTGNSATKEESKFIVHGDFYARSGGMSGSEVSISVTDVYNPNISLDGDVVGMHYGTDGGGWVNFDSTQDNSPYGDTAVIFDGSLYVNAEGHEGGDLHYANMSIDGGDDVVNYIYVKNDFIVGGAKNTASFSASDFYSFYFDAGTGKVFSIGKDDSASFTAENRAHFNPPTEGRGYFGERNRVTVDRSVEIAENATLTINNLMMDIRDSVTGNNVDFSHLGDINGENSELVFREGVVISGTDYAGGTVHLHSVRYENGVEAAVQRDGGTGMLDTKFNFYHGEYGSLGIWLDGRTDYKIDMDLFQEITIHNVTFINQNNDEGLHVNLVDGGVGVLTGSSGSVTMEGEFAFTEAKLPNTTFDFEVGSTVNVIYNRAFEQYVLSGNYYELTVTNTADKILAGNIVVGVSIDKIQELRRLYGTEDSKDAQIAARKFSHAYRGGISLGAGLRTMGYDVDFYGYTHAATEKAKIYSENAEGNVEGRVSYHVAQTLVNMDKSVQMTVTNPLTGSPMNVDVNVWDTGAVGGQSGLDMAGITATNHGVGPGVTGHSRTDEAYRAFFGGTYNDLTIDTMATLPPTAGIQWIPSEEITFTMDDSARIFGNMAVTAAWDGTPSTQHHYFSVNVTSDVTFVGNNNNIVLDDANLHFSGSVTGNFKSITAVRDEYYSANGVNDPTSLGAHERQLSLTFDQKMGNIGLLHTDGVSITFESDVASIRNVTVGTPGLHTGKVNTRDEVLTFNGSVELVDSVVTTRQFDDVKPIFNFNGETTGNATFDSFRSVVNFNHRGDLTIFQGAYDELYIAGEGDEFVDGVKTVIGNTTVGGTFNANLANITIENGTLSLQTFYEDFYGDLHRPHISVGAGAGLEFRAANTEGIRFYGTIESAGTITILGRGNFYGDITLTGEGNMSIDGSAEGSEFARVINRGSGFDIIRDININELHNYGEITIRNNNIGLDVYNHAGGNLIFDINSGTVGANGYEFNFSHGEGENIEWSDADSYVANDEVRHGNLYIANGDVPAGVEPGVEYWREIEAFDSSIEKTYKLGDIVFNTAGGVTTVYRSVDTYVPGSSNLSNTAYWEIVGTVATYSAGSTYAAGDLVLNGTSVYVAMTEVAAGTLPGTQYWTPVSHGDTNRLINGGTVTVNNGTLNLNNFTQGDKNAETGRWTYGGEGFVVGKLGTLVLGAAIDQINTGNNLPTGDVLDDSYLGSVSNSGTIKVADLAGDIKFVGEITNESGSKFILNNNQTTFNGNFVHHGSLTSGNASGTDIIFGTQSVVSGSGTIGGTQGYDGDVSYNGANQQILTGIYNDAVTLSTGVKTVAGDIVFNGDVSSSATVSGEGSSIRFNGNTTYTGYAGTFEGSLNVIYGDTASTVYSGSYGDLVINSTTAREIGVDLAAVNLTLNGENTFNGADADNIADVTVSGLITLSDNSSTTFGEFSSLNAGTDTAVMIKGGNYGTLTFSTAAIGENVTVNPEGLLATVTYDYVGEETQRILDGTYMNNVTLSGDSVKEISGSVNVNGELLSNNDSKLSVANGGVLEIVGTIQADSIEIAQGGTLTLILTGNSTLGTAADSVVTDPQGNITSASSTGVILGGTLNLRGNTSTTLSVYGWQDTGSAGEINVNSGVIRFEGVPGDYGYIKAIVNDYTDNGVFDPGNRLQNLWITITSDTLTSELERYGADSKFRIINGATLTVDYFDFPDAANPYIGTTVQSFRLEGNSYLVFAMVDPYAGTTITVNELIVQAGSNVVVNAGMTVEIGSSSALDGTISGAGNVTVENSTLSGTGVFNMTDGTVTYGANQSIYGGTYNNLQLGDSSTIAASATVNGVVSFAGALNIDGAAVAFKGINMGDAITLTNGASLNFTGTTNASSFAGAAKITGDDDTTVTYGENAGVYAGTYGSLTITGDHELAGSININTGASLTGVMSGSADVTFAAGAVLSGNGSFGSETTSYAGEVSYDGNSIFSGYYTSLTINNGGTVASGTNVAAEDIKLSGTLTVEGNMFFTGATNANSDGEINATAGTVTYASTADVYGGEYNTLLIYGSHNLVNNFTVNGTTTIFDNADESDASLTGTANLIFKGAVTGNGAYFGDGSDAYKGDVTYESSNGDILGGIYNNLTINASNEVIGSSFNVRGMLTLADGIQLSGNGDWAIGTTNASESSTARINNEGTVTYSGLAAGGSGWIYGGSYDNLVVDGGDYSVREVMIDSTLSGTGKIIFTAAVNGAGRAVDANADYLYGTTALAGTYNNLGIGAGVTIPGEVSSTVPNVIVNGELSALNDSARITGFGTLEIAGSLVAFNSLGRFDHSGNVIFSGNANYNVNGGTNGSRFNVLTVGEKAKLSVANTLFASLTGAGDVTVNTNVSGGVVDMSGGTVTYDADASAVLIQGAYNNLTLAQSGTLVRNSAEISVKGLFDVGAHDIINTGNLTIYTFTNEANLSNSGTLTFGANAESVSSPAVRQVWNGGLIENAGEVIINRSNYAIAAIVHDDQESSNWGTVTITESAQSKADFSDVVMVGIYSVSGENVADQGTVINLNANAYLFDVDNAAQFTNRGTLNIGGKAGKNAAPMHIINVHQGEITVNDIEYTFGKDSVQLTNGGSVTVNGENGVVIFNEVNENIAGNPVYTTRGGGTFKFDFAEDSSNFKNGLLGDLKNSNGKMYFLAEGQKYLGNVTNGNGTSTMGEMYIMADSTFRGSLTSTYGIVQIGDSIGGSSVNAIFLRNVNTGSYFQVLNKAYAEFNAQVTVEHEFYMESGSNALFKSNLAILSNTGNQADTLFHVKEGAKVVVNGDVLNQNGYDALLLDGGTYSTTSTPPTWRSEYYSATGWVTELRIEGHITIDGTLTNRAYGLERLHSFNDNNQARVVVESDGNVFGAIRNYGDAARFDMNGSNNQFNGVVENTGDLFLNGRNDYISIINDGYSISFKVDSTSISESSSGYVWINDNASGSTFRGVENKSGNTFTVGSYDSKGIDLRFEGPVSNSGTFNLNADGYVFNGVFTNNSSLRVDAVGFFNSEVVNKGNFNVAVEGVMFNKVTNSGAFSINAEKTVFTGMFTNSGTLNVNVKEITFPEMVNSGMVYLHSAYQTVIENLTQKSGIIDIDKDSTLHLHVVSDDADSKIIVRGNREGVFAEHINVNVSDSKHGLFFEKVEGLDKPQEINAAIVYDTDIIEDAVWFNEEYTYLAGEDALWIVVDQAWIEKNGNTLTDISLNERYRLVEGVTLTVMGTASGSRFQVKDGSTLVFANEQSLTINGMLEVKSADAVLVLSGLTTFNGVITNKGTVNISEKSENTFKEFNNFGTVNAYANVGGVINNNGSYVIKGSNIVVNDSLNNVNGTLSVEGSAQLSADIGGKIAIQEGVVLKVGVTEISSDLTNNGTVAINNDLNYLAVNGNVLNGNGTFTSSKPATLVFAGDVATGTSALFENIASVEYSGTSSGQNIILGTYSDLSITGAGKVIDDGTVTVNGGFSNNASLEITNDGALILNRNVAGNGIYFNSGSLVFSETASGSAATVNNSGVANVNADNFNVVFGSNTGSLNINGDGVSASVINTGTLIINGNDVDLETVNNGSVTVNGSNADLAGQNNSSVTVNGSAATTMSDQAGASYNVAQGGALSLGDNGGTYNASINNMGTITVDAPVNSFAGGVTNNGTVNVNEGTGLDAARLIEGNANGVINLNDADTDLKNLEIKGNVQVNYALTDDALAGVIISENSIFGINVDSELNEAIADNNGTVQVGKNATLVYTDQVSVINGKYDVDGAISVEGNANFTGAVDNSGNISVGGSAAFDDAVSNSGSISVGGSAYFDNAVSNSGNISVGGSADFDNAVSNSGIIGSANVIFSGATSGNGAVKALTASYEGNATGIFGGTYGDLSISTKARMLGDASTGSMTLYGSLATHKNGVLSIAGERFSSENFNGSGSGNWSVFTAVGGVGDAWPSLMNPNFQAIAVHMGSLSLEWADTARFDLFRRMPVDRMPMAVGDAGDAIEFNTVDSYDMINFDGEFFGEEGIAILDDESRDVLEDAVSAEASDLKALLED